MNQNASTSISCTVCGGTKIDDLLAINEIPVHCNLLWQTRADAVAAPCGDIHLVVCWNCCHIFNKSFDAGSMQYTVEYENSLHFSPRFEEYAKELAVRLVEEHKLYDKDIVEIGCGQGDFLRLLCELGGNRGAGFDPSYMGEANDTNNEVTIIRDYYTEAYADYPADFICSRHVLEHIQQPNEFVSMVRRVVGDRDNTVVFFEVPSVLFTLYQLGIWDIIYEHCSYFSPNSLAALFRQSGFRVLQILESFGDQFLTIEAAPVNGDESQNAPVSAMMQSLTQEATRFAENYKRKVDFHRQRLKDLAGQGKKIVVWGAGSKGVMFLNTLKTQGIIEFAVDINPRKEGMYVAGTGQEIIPPKRLQEYRPDVVIVMNANYQDEIRQNLETLGLSADILLA